MCFLRRERVSEMENPTVLEMIEHEMMLERVRPTDTIEEIIQSYCEVSEHTGLVNIENDACGCRFDDLAPCGCIGTGCKGGYLAGDAETWLVYLEKPEEDD